MGLLVLLVSLTSTIWLWRAARATNRKEVQAYLDASARDAQSRIENRLTSYALVLQGAQGLAMADSRLDRASWKAYVEALHLERDFPGIQGVSYCPLVRPRDRDLHVAAVRREGFTGYDIRPPGVREIQSPVQWIEPFDGINQRAFGYDTFSEGVRRQALERARDEGTLALSGRLTLVQEAAQGAQVGFLMVLPVYRKGAPVRTVDERRQALVAWVTSPFRMNDLIGGIFGEQSKDLDIDVFDGEALTPETLMYGDFFDRPRQRFGRQIIHPLTIYGRTWTLAVCPRPVFMTTSGAMRPDTILIIGFLGSLVLALLAWSLANSQDRALHSVGKGLKRSEERLRLSTELAKVAVWEYDLLANTMSRSENHDALYFLEPQEAWDFRTFLEAIHPDDRQPSMDNIQNSVAPGGPDRYETDFRVESPGQPIRWLAAIGQVVARNEEGRGTMVRGCLIDITERKLAEKETQAIRMRLEAALASMTDALSISDADGRFVEFNDAFANFHRFNNKGECAKTFAEYPEILDVFMANGEPAPVEEWAVSRALRGESASNVEFTLRRKDTGESWVGSYSFAPILGEGGGIIGSVVAARDITHQKRTAVALEESRALLQSIINGTTDAIYVKDLEGRYLLFSAGAERMVGKPAQEVLGKDDTSLFPPLEATNMMEGDRKIMASGRVATYEERVTDSQGNPAVFLSTKGPLFDNYGKLVGLFGIARDITERLQIQEENAKLQAQLQQSQKMESLGNLAGGIAHDMNNVLGAILGMATASIHAQPVDSPSHHAFETIIQATTRGGKMVKSLLSFARQNPEEERVLDINQVLQEEARMLERTTLAKIRIEMDLAPDLQPIRGDAGALTHAFMNLCVNAVDAMPDNGVLTLRTRNIDNEWIEVLVEDTGTGMSKEVLSKALDPFFTTKEVGKGTGLGLSMVYRTMQAHRGQMEIQSDLGRGTCVRMRFPVCDPAVPQTESPMGPTAEMPCRPLAVLLVDDDELIQSSMSAILDMLGHEVVAVTSGEEALARLDSGLHPDVVILDINMPGLGGAGTLPRLRALRPGLPVLLATGRIDQFALDLVSADPFVSLLSKPFSMDELGQHLARLERSGDSLQA